MKIYLIRHGETTGDVEDRYGGDYDDHLTEKGEEQADGLAKKLKGKHIEIIFHSPRIRARKTAEIVGKELGVKTVQIDYLRERNHYGILTGMIKSECRKKYPEEVNELDEKGIHSEVKNSEFYPDFKKRITGVFKSITAGHHKCIAIISHGGVIRGFMREMAKAGELSKLGDCGIIELESKNGMYKVISLDGVRLS